MNRVLWIFSSFLLFVFSVSIAHTSSYKETFLTIMTFNIENGGTQVDFNQVVHAIKRAKADVVGVQEAWGNAKRLAKELNWNYYDPSQHIISRFPLFKTQSQPSYVLIEINPNQFISIANVHLPDALYGPELIEQGAIKAKVNASEIKIRLAAAKPVIDQLTVLASLGIPTFLTGDFNSPSHLDWNEKTLHKRQNHRYVMSWPLTQYLANHGFIDSYRKIFPDSYKHPGFTWPAGRPHLKNALDNYNPSNSDLPERIDFVFYSGPATVIDSHVIGEKNDENSNYNRPPWPSDHRAVVSRFKVKCSNYPLQQKKLIPIIGEYQNKKPVLIVPHTLLVDEPLPITWKNAPGYAYDYISISPEVDSDLSRTVRLYTHGKVNGFMYYSNKNVHGNWIYWYRTSHANWPLAPGVYHVKLMLDDGFTVLASTKLVIKP